MPNRIKNQGGVYTPSHIVCDMLDLLGWTADVGILEKHIMENSCGDGAFLSEIVRRYCNAFLLIANNEPKRLACELSTYIHGIEKEPLEVEKCRANLDAVAAEFGIHGISWDIRCADALRVSEYDGKMDFVVGNPPYVRVHNLEDYKTVKKFSFARNGMTDLYIVFFEIGLNMLNEHGKMCYITPSSFLKSKSGTELRKYIQQTKYLTKVIDIGHSKVFDATTYPMITLFDKYFDAERDLMGQASVGYKSYEEQDFSVVGYPDIFSDGKISFDNTDNLQMLAEIEECYKSQGTREITVKNGFATLADNVFIGDFNIKDEIVIDILKASTGKWRKCIYPYYFNGMAMAEADVQKHPAAYEYLTKHKSKLLSRDIGKEEDWFLFGRNQGVKDTFRNKVAINTIIKDVNSIKLNKVPVGSGIYGGLYILSDYSFAELHQVLCCKDFINYIRMLKKYKSGGYYTFSSLDLEKYLVYKLKGKRNAKTQLGLFAKVG